MSRTVRAVCFLCAFGAGFLTCSIVPGDQSALKIHFINVGYGDAILLEWPDRRYWLVDAGPKASSETLIHYLKENNVSSIEAAVVTHPHKNHFNGFRTLIEHFPITRVYTNGDGNADIGYLPLLNAFRQKDIPVSSVKEGHAFDGIPEGTSLKVLHPATLSGGANENSLVLLVEHQEVLIVLTADIGLQQQKELVKRYPELSSAKVVQVPHHGRDLSAEFLTFFGGDTLFVVSTGLNPWGPPDEMALEQSQGKVYRTDIHGHIVIRSDGSSINVIDEP